MVVYKVVACEITACESVAYRIYHPNRTATEFCCFLCQASLHAVPCFQHYHKGVAPDIDEFLKNIMFPL